MHVETIRALADWLQYGTNGSAGAANGPGSANAMAGAVPRDSGDPVPVTIATFGDETRTPYLARREIPRESGLVFPILGVIVSDGGDIDGEVETIVRDGTVIATVLYAHHEVVTEKGLRDWHYTCRGIQRSVKQWMLQANEAFRTRNQVVVRACMGMQTVPPFTMKGDVTFSGGLTLRFAVRDENP